MPNKPAPRITLTDIPPLRPPAPTLLDLARRGAEDGDSLGAQSVELICKALIAAQAQNAALERQLELQIDSLVVSAVFPEPAEFRDEPTARAVRRTPAIIRRNQHTAPTKVLGAQKGAQS